MEFQEFPKMARLSRECVITEKIDGTNAQVHIVDLTGTVSTDESRSWLDVFALAVRGDVVLLAGSRSKYLSVGRDGKKDGDNFGFAKWAQTHADELFTLGPGRHFGEWWGSGIQRGYGLTNGEKRFSLFNTVRFCEHNAEPLAIKTSPDPRVEPKMQERLPACVSLVPVLWRGVFHSDRVNDALQVLSAFGSKASPGFMDPEGVVVFHMAGGVGFKKTLEKDDEPKSKAAA